jgi:hypothetical protein
MLGMGLQPTTSMFERANTVHALARPATVIGNSISTLLKFIHAITTKDALTIVNGAADVQPADMRISSLSS